MVFTGAMAQQKPKEAALKTKSTEEVKLNKKGIEGSQSANADVFLKSQDLKSKSEEKKSVINQKLKEKKEAIDKKAANAKGSTNTEVGIGETVSSSTHGAEVSSTAKSDITAQTKGTVVSDVASAQNQGKAVVKTAGNLSGHLNSSIKSVPAAVKTDVKVKTDVNVRPKPINAKVKTATGIKL